jgi:hypothetical protein
MTLQRRILWFQVISRTAEAYGNMILTSGLFQADGHPGNILVMPNGVIGLIDYGQSKQLSDKDRLLFAQLVLALAKCAHRPPVLKCMPRRYRKPRQGSSCVPDTVCMCVCVYSVHVHLCFGPLVFA